MKTVDPDMQTHLESGVTAISTCWAIVRRDGEILYLTDHDQDILVTLFDYPLHDLNGLYKANSGFERSAIQHTQDGVSNSEMTVILHADAITASDISAERYDNARIHTFLVSWEDVATRGAILMPGSGWVGSLDGMIRQGTYKVELRGMAQALKNQVGNDYLPVCRVDLFSRKCTKDESDFMQNGLVTAVTNKRIFDCAFVPATFTPTAQTIPFSNFDANQTDPTPWIDELTEELGISAAAGPHFTSLDVPFNGSHALHSNQFGSTPSTIQLDTPYAIRSPVITLTATGAETAAMQAAIDAGKAVFDLTVSIALKSGTTPAIKSESRIGIRWLTGAGVHISDNRSAELNETNHGLTVALQAVTRRFSVPPLARKFAIRFESIKRDPASDYAIVTYDDVSGMIRPTPAIVLGQNREAVTLQDWFQNGLVVFRSGSNEGISREIEAYDDTTKQFSLFMPVPFVPAPGDVFEVYAGCKHRWIQDCVAKFDNGINFRGEPFVPGDDFRISSPDVKQPVVLT